MKWILGLALIGIGAALIFIGRDNQPEPMSDTSTLSLTSSAFEHNGTIPTKYTCDGDRTLSPPLAISGVPEGADSLVLIMDDPDVPKERRPSGVFDHWVVYAIPPDTAEIAEGALVGAQGLNSGGNAAYTGPCPPPEFEPSEHRYIFKLYAISGTLNFIKAPTKDEVLAALEGKILAEAELIGRYSRK
jgi:hypothetical protein